MVASIVERESVCGIETTLAVPEQPLRTEGVVSTPQTDSRFTITSAISTPKSSDLDYSSLLKGNREDQDQERCYYLPMRIKMPAASARIPIMIVGIVMWNSRVIPARIR